jgi:two-component system CheB/CheR fusion protein
MTTDKAAELHILIAEDNDDCADSLAVILRHSGHEVDVARDGMAALEAAETLRPDVLLLDLGLPGISGYEVAKRLKNKPWLKKPFIIAVTGYGQEEDRRRSAQSGIDLHLLKPVEPIWLCTLLGRLQTVVTGGGIGREKTGPVESPLWARSL